MEVIGVIKVLNDTQNIGNNGFRKREVVITTDEQYSQFISIEFIQDKCDLLNNFKVGQQVRISINLRGREWINPEGVAKYFNAIQGWRIELLQDNNAVSSGDLTENEPVSFIEEEKSGLPF